MKFTTTKGEFLRAIQAVGRAVPARAPIPVLTHIKIEASKEGLQLAATDLELAVTAKARATVATDGAVLLPGRTLAEIIGKLPDGDVTVDGDGNDVTIKAGRSKFTLRGLPAAEFPELPEVAGESVTMDAQVLAAAIKGATYATAGDDKAVICGGLFQLNDGGLSIVATDGYRLAVKTAPIANAPEMSLVIPRRGLDEMARHLGSVEGEVTIATAGNQVAVEVDGRRITTRTIDGQFPPYKSILPTSFAAEAVVNRAALLGAVERVAVMALDQEAHIIKVEFSEDTITVKGGSGDRGAAEEAVGAGYVGEPLAVSFNADFLAECLKNTEGETIRIKLNTPTSPVIIIPEGKWASNGTALLMPVNRV